MFNISRLSTSSSSLFLFVPLMGLQVAVASRSPWWNLPWPQISLWCLATFLILFPLVRWLQGGWAWPVTLVRVLAAGWILGDIYLAVDLPQLWMGIFALGLALAVTFLTQWIRSELQVSYVDSGAKWYEGAPPAIPRLKAVLEVPEGEVEFFVSRISREGLFIFSEMPQLEQWTSTRAAKAPIRLRIERDKEVLDLGARYSHGFRRGLGAGFRFAGLSADEGKYLGDLVERLRGEGYAVE